MSLKKHVHYKEEVKRLEETMAYIEDAITATEKNKELHDEDIRDAYIELDFLDSSQSYVTILVNSMLMEELEKNFHNLVKARKKPYFARIDFREEGSHKIDQLYIGRMSLTRPQWEIPFITDWRSPIASIYYDGRLGEVSYKTHIEEGEIHGELFLKRQYTISDGKLESMMDIDITATDTFLQASLGGNADNRLKDIVSTIQKEQNEIIRAPLDKPLVVQGVAGSGKTTIALHRIAYLIYTYEKRFFPENFMIIAPNHLFLNYISEVLPELGVEKVKQTTFIEFMFELLGKSHKITDPDLKLTTIINASTSQGHSIDFMKKASDLKGSMLFRKLVERYIRQLEKRFVPMEDFALEGYVLMTYKEIQRLFIEEYSYLPFQKRLAEIKKNLTTVLSRDKKRIMDRIEASYDKKIELLRHKNRDGSLRLQIVSFIDKRDALLETLKKRSKTLISKYLGKFPKEDVFFYYRDLLSTPENLELLSNGHLELDLARYISNQSTEMLIANTLELEDLAPLAYMKSRIFGFSKPLDIKVAVIDEAQDFSHFQFFTLKQILNTQLFTILGDLSQGIHSYRAIREWNYLLEKIFDPQKSTYLTLEQSYRTTIEIMDLANEIIKKFPMEGQVLAKPVLRHGEKPSIQFLDTRDAIITETIGKVLSLKKEGYQSIAIIGKTLKECKEIKNELDKTQKLKCKLLDDKESKYNDAIVILPSYLAKGLEFDATFIINLEESYTTEELDVKLLYVAATRALHRLYIYALKGRIPILENTP
jgi:DNA helicase II / ATP-dependent DNA helicase PcrA